MENFDLHQLLTHRFKIARIIAKDLIDLEISKYVDFNLTDAGEDFVFLQLKKKKTSIRDFILFSLSGELHQYHWDPLTGHDHILQDIGRETLIHNIKNLISYLLSGYYDA